jgi:hypothetical protein
MGSYSIMWAPNHESCLLFFPFPIYLTGERFNQRAKKKKSKQT